MKYKTITLPGMAGKTLKEVRNYLLKEYPNKLAGEEHREDFMSISPKLPTWNYYFFFKEIKQDSFGHWRVPFANWYRSSWGRGTNWLGETWHTGFLVVLLDNYLSEETDRIDQAIKLLKQEGYKISKEY